MSFEVTGKLLVKYDIQQKTDSFKTREFVIEKQDEIGGRIISNYIKFQCTQERVALPDRFNIGDEVKVYFNVRGTKWNKDGKDLYFTNLDAWRMEVMQLGGQESAPSNTASTRSSSSSMPDMPPAQTPAYEEPVADDLPF